MTRTSPVAAWGAWLTCTVVWGSTFLVIAYGNDTMPPVWGATLRLTIAALILAAIQIVRRHPLPRGPALASAAQFGLFQFGINFPLLYIGETGVPSGIAAVIFSTIPLTMTFLTWVFRLERPAPGRILGALVALAGMVVIFSSEFGELTHLWPMAFVLLSSWSACLGSVLLKRGPRQSPIGANAVGAAIGAVVCLVWSRALGEPQTLPHAWTAILPLLYLAILGSVVAFVAMAWLINHWEVTRISYISLVTPLVAIALGAMLRHERVPGPALAGAAIVLLGVALGVLRRAPAPA